MEEKLIRHLKLAYASRKAKNRNTITLSMPVKHVIITGLISMEFNKIITQCVVEAKNDYVTSDMKLVSLKG